MRIEEILALGRVGAGALIFLGALLVLSACGPASPTPEAMREASTAPPPGAEPASGATETPEYRWAQLLGRDDIAPIYHPEFVTADQADYYADDELVLGVAIEREAKAYPIGLLSQREMVNDELAGIPILATW